MRAEETEPGALSAGAPIIKTFGCRLNAYEAEVIRGHAAGQDDLVVVNTCAVTAEAERQGRAAVRRAVRERPGARVVVTGCAVQIDPAAWAALPGVHRVLGNVDKLRAESWLAGAVSAVSDIRAARGRMPPGADPTPGAAGFERRARALVEVQQGCSHACTFCVIPQGRGPSRSLPVGGVVEQVRGLVAAGYREVVLTGVDIASYGPDLPGRPGLGALVRRVLALVPDLPRLRLSSLDPAAVDDELWRLIAEEPRLMPHLHLSVQAGSDLVLKRMRRRHGRTAALAVIARARRLRPGIAIGADLIAGFPTETEALFRETLDFVGEAAIPYLHVFPYSERPGTPAARMPAVPVPERRARAAALRAAAAVYAEAFHAAMLGRAVQVVAERGGRGHTEHFAPVRLIEDCDAAACEPGRLVAGMVVAAGAAGLIVRPGRHTVPVHDAGPVPAAPGGGRVAGVGVWL